MFWSRTDTQSTIKAARHHLTNKGSYVLMSGLKFTTVHCNRTCGPIIARFSTRNGVFRARICPCKCVCGVEIVTSSHSPKTDKKTDPGAFHNYLFVVVSTASFGKTLLITHSACEQRIFGRTFKKLKGGWFVHSRTYLIRPVGIQ